MATTIKILVNRKDYEGMDLHKIYNSLVNFELFDKLPGWYGSYRPWEDNNPSYTGEERPEAVRELVKDWNRKSEGRLREAWEAFEEEAKSRGMSMLDCFADIAYGRQDSAGHYDEFVQAVRRSNGSYTGDDVLFRLPDEQDDGQMVTYLPEEAREDCLAHPERYAVIVSFGN